jgi:hypothetical protein
MGPFSICSVVPPEGHGIVPVSSRAENVVVWTVGCPDSWVCPADWDVDPPVVRVVPGIVVPLFSISLPWLKLCFCCPHAALGTMHPNALSGFEEDLDEDIFI